MTTFAFKFFFCHCRTIWLLFFLFHSLIATVKKKREKEKKGVANCSMYICVCVCSDDEDCLIINFFYALQALHIFDDVWNDVRFIRWDLQKGKRISKEITDLHVWRIFSYSMFIFLKDRFFNCKHIYTHVWSSPHYDYKHVWTNPY
jgi:hypothetical protein